ASKEAKTQSRLKLDGYYNTADMWQGLRQITDNQGLCAQAQDPCASSHHATEGIMSHVTTDRLNGHSVPLRFHILATYLKSPEVKLAVFGRAGVGKSALEKAPVTHLVVQAPLRILLSLTETLTAEGCQERGARRRRGRRRVIVLPQPLQGNPPCSWELSTPVQQGRVLLGNLGGGALSVVRTQWSTGTGTMVTSFRGPTLRGSYYPYWDYGEYEWSEECQDISLWSNSEVYYLENPIMEVEEALREDSPSVTDTWSADSERDEPPAPKTLPHLGHTSPGAACKPQRDKKEASPVPAPETGKTTGAPPKAYAPKPEKPSPPSSAKGDPPQQMCPSLCLLLFCLCPSPHCAACTDPCRFAQSSGFAIRRAFWGRSPIGCVCEGWGGAVTMPPHMGKEIALQTEAGPLEPIQTLVVRFLTKRFIWEYDPTLESTYRHQANIDDEMVSMEILDTAGQEDQLQREGNMRWGDGFVLVYDITDRGSFEDVAPLRGMLDEVRRPKLAPVVLVGNKADLEHARQVATEEGERLAADMACAFYECSACAEHAGTGGGVAEAFYELCREVWKQGSHTEPQSSESDSVDPYVPACREQTDQEDRCLEMDPAGSYDPYLDDHRGDRDYRETEESSDIGLQSDRGSECEEEAPMEVEEYPHRDLPSHGDAKSSKSKEPPAPKAPPRACHPGASRLTWVASREAPLSDKDTPPPEAKSSRAYAPTMKPRAGKKAAAPEPGQSLLPKLERDISRQASTQPTTGGLVGAPSPFPGLLNVCGVIHVPVPVTVSVPITLNVPVTLFPFVSVPVPVSVCVPVSVIVLVRVLPLANLLALARGGLSGPPMSLFGVGLGVVARVHNLSMNMDKTKEMVVDFRKLWVDHSPLNIDSSVEIFPSSMFPGVKLVQNFTWTLNSSSIAKKTQQQLYILRRLRKAHPSTTILTMIYKGTVESILSSCITA
ncbi:hypothetical protein P4O66_015440, partial [Electrophorus voltai]